MSYSIEQDIIDSLTDSPDDWDDYREENLEMFSEIKLWPNKNSNSKIRANGSCLISNAIRLKFTVAQGSKGLFVGLPSRAYKDKEGNTKYSNEVFIEDKTVMKQLTEQVIAAYNEQTGAMLNQGDAAGPSSQDADIPW